MSYGSTMLTRQLACVHIFQGLTAAGLTEVATGRAATRTEGQHDILQARPGGDALLRSAGRPGQDQQDHSRRPPNRGSLCWSRSAVRLCSLVWRRSISGDRSRRGGVHVALLGSLDGSPVDGVLPAHGDQRAAPVECGAGNAARRAAPSHVPATSCRTGGQAGRRLCPHRVFPVTSRPRRTHGHDAAHGQPHTKRLGAVRHHLVRAKKDRHLEATRPGYDC